MKLTHRDTGDTIEVPDQSVPVYRKAGWAPADEKPADPPVEDPEAEPPVDDTPKRKPRT